MKLTKMSAPTPSLTSGAHMTALGARGKESRLNDKMGFSTDGPSLQKTQAQKISH
jgi:hypothetical protein